MSEKKIPDEDAQKIKKLEKQVTQSRRSLEELRHEKLFSEKVLDSLPGIFYLYNERGISSAGIKTTKRLPGFPAKSFNGERSWTGLRDPKRNTLPPGSMRSSPKEKRWPRPI